MVRKGAELPAAQCGRYYLIRPHPRGRGAEPLRRAAACQSSGISYDRVRGVPKQTHQLRPLKGAPKLTHPADMRKGVLKLGVNLAIGNLAVSNGGEGIGGEGLEDVFL